MTREFQQYAGLAMTGHLDKASVEKMKEPRCGMPDVVKPSLRPEIDENAPLSYVLKGIFVKNIMTHFMKACYSATSYIFIT